MKLKSFIVILSLLAFVSSQAQSKQKKKDEKVIEIPPPPPPSTPPPGVDVQVTEKEEMPPQEAILDTTPPPADSLTGAIRKMLRLSGALNIGKQFGQMIAESSATTPLEREINQRILAKFQEPAIHKVYEGLIIRIYRQYLTLQDINAINAFYESPVGKKYSGLLPSILDASKTEALNFGMWVYGQVMNEMSGEKSNK